MNIEHKDSTMSDFNAPRVLNISPMDANKMITIAVRVLQIFTVLITAAWISLMGGLRLSPTPTVDGENNTGALFNWHPLLIVIAFPVLMTEAVLAFKSPLINFKERQQRKMWHFALHSTAIFLIILAVIAVFKSHSLKKPLPMSDLYSTHSFAGITILCLIALQYLIGATAYLWPKWSLEHRRLLGPLHIFFGGAVYIAGLATMMTGIQEKATFLQLAGHVSVTSAAMRLPAVLQIVLILLGVAVMYHHAVPSSSGGGGYNRVGTSNNNNNNNSGGVIDDVTALRRENNFTLSDAPEHQI